ncbi:MAG: hypothetical protein QOE62_701 [Actinomycetota bacterium]|nr:hypothetical protein [Actinomycetota bacterium]
MKRGDRIVRNGKELIERLGRNDPCPCGSGRRFQAVLHARRHIRWVAPRLTVATDVSIGGGFGCADRQSDARDVLSGVQSLAVALLVAGRSWHYLLGVSA